MSHVGGARGRPAQARRAEGRPHTTACRWEVQDEANVIQETVGMQGMQLVVYAVCAVCCAARHPPADSLSLEADPLPGMLTGAEAPALSESVAHTHTTQTMDESGEDASTGSQRAAAIHSHETHSYQECRCPNSDTARHTACAETLAALHPHPPPVLAPPPLDPPPPPDSAR